MSDAKWCDYGDHAFSARETGTQTISVTQNAPDQYGNPRPVQIVKDLCRACAEKLGLVDAGEQMRKELGKGKP